MKSRITIDMDWDNQPIIKIDYQPSDDVRDKMVKTFMSTFGGESYFATFFYNNGIHDLNQNRQAVIRPLRPEELKNHLDGINSIIKNSPEVQESQV